ncbi:hypothetical protein BDV93DRAFT_57833 [Ceratobasidium sp. AG-I]|nr:hypothetical protein BDV93DRAFT_57833 [Ceratobasidium sp. AG-I]
MPRAAALTRKDDSHRPNKRMKLSHRRDRSSISILGSITNIGSTIAGIAGRLFSPSNEQFEDRLNIHTLPQEPLEEAPKSSSMSLLSAMADEQAAFWDLLEYVPEKPRLSQPSWFDIHTATEQFSVRINYREPFEPQSFLDMNDSEDEGDSPCATTHPTAGHSAFSDYDSDEETDESDLMDTQSSASTDSSSLPSPSACAASTGHSLWQQEPRSGDEYWDRQNALLCAKHVRDAFPDAQPRTRIPLERFIADILRNTRGAVRDDAAFVALQFIKRLSPACPLGYYEDMFFTLLVLADKMENDFGHPLRWWSDRCNGLWTLSELRTMEKHMLQALDWDLSTSLNCRSSYQSFLVDLASFAPSV